MRTYILESKRGHLIFVYCWWRSVDSAPSTRSTGVDELSSPFTVPGFGAAATCHPTMHQLKWTEYAWVSQPRQTVSSHFLWEQVWFTKKNRRCSARVTISHLPTLAPLTTLSLIAQKKDIWHRGKWPDAFTLLAVVRTVLSDTSTYIGVFKPIILYLACEVIAEAFAYMCYFFVVKGRCILKRLCNGTRSLLFLLWALPILSVSCWLLLTPRNRILTRKGPEQIPAWFVDLCLCFWHAIFLLCCVAWQLKFYFLMQGHSSWYCKGGYYCLWCCRATYSCNCCGQCQWLLQGIYT